MEIHKYKISDITSEQLEKFRPFCEKKELNIKPQSIAAHYFLKSLLALHYGLDITEICLKYGEQSKPFYKDDVKFSITHTGDYVFIALSRKKIGIDAEYIREINKKLVSRTANTNEINVLETSEQFNVDFLKMWTVKEAYFKCTGTGITDPAAVTVFDIKQNYTVKTYTDSNYIISTVEEK